MYIVLDKIIYYRIDLKILPYINTFINIYKFGDYMVSVTLAVSREIKDKMNKYNEINWSEYIRKNIFKKIKQLDTIEDIILKEKSISNWAVKLQKKSRKNRYKELTEKGLI